MMTTPRCHWHHCTTSNNAMMPNYGIWSCRYYGIQSCQYLWIILLKNFKCMTMMTTPGCHQHCRTTSDNVMMPNYYGIWSHWYLQIILFKSFKCTTMMMTPGCRRHCCTTSDNAMMPNYYGIQSHQYLQTILLKKFSAWQWWRLPDVIGIVTPPPTMRWCQTMASGVISISRLFY